MKFVAEIGLNYDGRFDLAYELIRQAAASGADFVKFQFGWRGGKDEMNFMDAERVGKLKDWAAYCGVGIFASVFNEEGFELAKLLDPPCYKIASRTVKDDPALCQRVLNEGKPTFVSLGMWDGKDLPLGPPVANRLMYIYCVAKYPAEPADMQSFPAKFALEDYYGYSDHFRGLEACLLAIARGAQYIEKHFTLDKTSPVIRDHILSATPEEFHTLTSVGRTLAAFVSRLPA